VPVKTNNGMIRLGNIVVSKPAGEHSGAIRYDHGKAETGHFRRTGALAAPAAVLLSDYTHVLTLTLVKSLLGARNGFLIDCHNQLDN
jgi:hypothetical protein